MLTDDLLREPYASLVGEIRENLTDKATIKLWGCSAGVKKWVYSDNGVTDLTAEPKQPKAGSHRTAR